MTQQKMISALVTIVMLLSLVPAFAGRMVRTIFVQPPEGAPEKVYLFTGKDYLEAELPSKSLSQEIEIPDGDVNLVVLATRPAGNAALPTDAPRVKIPQAWSRCILLFFPDPTNKSIRGRVMPLNASMTDFPAGSTRIYNLSTAAVFAKFGEEAMKLPAGQVASIKAPRGGFGDYPVAIDCLAVGETKPRALCRTSWQHDPASRQILFVTPVEGYSIPKVWGVLDQDPKK